MNARIAHDSLNDATLIRRLEAGELAVVPTVRAAQALRQVFGAHQQAQGKRAWQAPHVFSWNSWTASLWSELVVSGADPRLLLNRLQEHSLWAELIAEHAPGGILEQKLPALAKLAQSGFALAAAWECLPRLRSTSVTHDHHTFALWAEAFQQRCDHEGYVPSAGVERLLRQHLERPGNVAPAVPPTLLLLDWPEFTPTQSRLLEAFGKRGTKTESIFTASPLLRSSASARFDARRLPPRVLALAPDEREELFCAARWIRTQIEKAPKDTDPAALRVGVLLPGGPLPELEAVFREVLAPELQAITADLSAAPWEFSRNELLAAVPLIATALDLARLCVQPLSLAVVSTLLLSPYLGEEADCESNARFDARGLRRTLRLRPEITLRALASGVSTEARNGSGPLSAPWVSALNEFAAKALDPKLRRSYSEWMEVLRRLVRIAGWPGARTLSAREHAALRAWESTLDLVATLDFAGCRVGFATALEAVERQAREASLDLRSKGAPVTVLTVSEAAGCAFDVLVLLRGSDDKWPPSRQPHSLLSIGLQKELGMPGTDPRRERHLIESLLGASGTALATCAQANAEGSLRPAPLFRDLGFEQIAAARLGSSLRPLLPVSEEQVADHIPLPPLPSTQVRGGARVLQLQAACGFRAFAEVRLGATEVESRGAGFDPRELGNLVHRTLERFWSRVRSQAALRAMPFGERDALLAECIDEAVSPKLQLETAWDHAYLALQKQRLRRLFHQWMDSELQRAPFTVAALEQEEHIQLGSLDLRVRLDRLDQLDHVDHLNHPDHPDYPDHLDPIDSPDRLGIPEPLDSRQTRSAGLVLVDYKSGTAADPKAWSGDRPDQPQLPLYALLPQEGKVKGVAFAHICYGKMKYAGLEEEPGILGTHRSSALETGQIEQWRTVLSALAEEFSQGMSQVRPKNGTETCKYCAQRLLCRLDPAALVPREEPESEALKPSEGVYG